ncbi:MAG: threonine synthase [Thermoplasmataceae archaeon]
MAANGESWLSCIKCGQKYSISRRKYICDRCHGLLEVKHTFTENFTEEGFRGVWHYKPLIHPSLEKARIVSRGEGATALYSHDSVSEFAGISGLRMKHEGENPTGSFKDRGMTVAVSEAIRLGATETVCASTGNTSASAASYSALAGIKSNVLIPSGNVSPSKLSQAIAYGARIIDTPGDFDMAMKNVARIAENSLDYYVLNSINPWRVEGQKTIFFEIMNELKECRFIALPAGNLGNTSAAGKAIREFSELGLINDIPEIISVQAEGASPFYNLWAGGMEKLEPVKASTIASAIRIGNPVNWEKAIREIRYTGGMVVTVSDREIMEAKRVVDRSGIGCEPASAASVAGLKKLVDEGKIDRNDRAVAVLTGNILKDTASIMEDSARIPMETFMRELLA